MDLDLDDYNRRTELVRLKKEKRQRELQQFKERRKNHSFHPIARRLQHLKPSDRKALLRANSNIFIDSINELMSVPVQFYDDDPIITILDKFPSVPKDEPTNDDMNKLAEQMALDVNVVFFPKIPSDSPVAASPSGLTFEEIEILNRIRKLNTPGKPRFDMSPYLASPTGLSKEDLKLLQKIRGDQDEITLDINRFKLFFDYDKY